MSGRVKSKSSDKTKGRIKTTFEWWAGGLIPFRVHGRVESKK